MNRLSILIIVTVLAAPITAKADCKWSWCDNGSSVSAPTAGDSWSITNRHRQRQGDIYNPGTGRLQIRDNHRRIQGYIEKDGTITNRDRQPIGKIERSD